MVGEFQRAQRMGDAFDGVRLAVGEIVASVVELTFVPSFAAGAETNVNSNTTLDS